MRLWQRSMNLRIKIFLALLLVGVGSSLLSSWEHYDFIQTTLTNKSIDHFTSIRDGRKREIEYYFNRMQTATLMLSKGWTIVAAAKDFEKAFNALPEELPGRSGQGAALPESLRKRYEPIVDSVMSHTGKSAASELDMILPREPRVIYLQNLYAAENVSAPLPQKTPNKVHTTYEQVHARYHAFFKAYRQDLNVHDVFLIDSTTGAIVYSTRKSVDYATNLLTGPWKEGPLATVFKNVVAAPDDGVQMMDFEHYCPSRHLPAAFIAAPVRDGAKTIAVLVLQISITEINAVMTDNKNWQARGLGASGETYILGPDSTMRNDSRFLLESEDLFFARIKAQKAPEAILSEMHQDKTSILLLKVSTEASQRALQGQTGTALINDYRGIPVLSAYTPLDIPGLQWVLLAEMDQDEIFASIARLRERIFFQLMISLILIAVIGAALAFSIVKPIRTLSKGVRRIGQGAMSDRVDVTTRDEIGELANAFNELAANLSLKTVSLDYFSSIINSMNEMLFVLHVDEKGQTTTIAKVNQAAVTKLGYEKKQLVGQGVDDFLLEKDGEKLFSGERLTALLEKRWSQGSEKIFLTRKGGKIPVILSASVMHDPAEATVTGIVLLAQDITALQKSEQQLRRVNRALKTLIGCNQAVSAAQTEEALLHGICEAVVDKGGYRLAWIGFAEQNPEKTVRVAAQAGYDDGYLENLRISWGNDEWGGGPTGMAIKSGEIQVAWHILTDSRYYPWREQASRRGYQSSIALPLFDQAQDSSIGALNIYAPEPDAFDAREIGLLQDIAEDVVSGLNNLRIKREHVMASEALVRSEERFRGIFEQAAVGIALVTTEGRWTMVNQKLCSLLGYHREELLQLSFQGVTHPDDLDTSLHYVDRMLSGEINHYAFEKRYIRKDGQLFWGNLTVSLVRDEQGQPQFFISVIEDISARKYAEAEQEKLVAIIERSPDFIGISDLDGQLLYLNNAGRKLAGLSASAEINETNVIDCLAPSGREHFKHDFFEPALASGSGQGEFIFAQLGSGELHPVELYVFSIFSSMDKNITGMALIARDLTERHENESRLRQAQKMEAMGTLAGGIAHDFNNILSAILGYAQLAAVESPVGSAVHNDLQEVIGASLRATDLVRQILTFSRKGEHALVPLKPHLIVKESLKLLRASLPSTIAMEVDIPDCGTILADPTQLHQIMMNLCTNAFHAMEKEKGVLKVAMARRELEAKENGGESHAPAGSYVEITVSDTGCGMDAGTLGRIYEPYFTTKEVGSGTGLGLALVHSIVEGCGGMIKVKSAPGVGTSFRVYLPSYTETVTQKKEEGGGEILTGNERILVVDDESSIVNLHKSSLAKLGYQVTGTTSSLEALALFTDNPDAFDVLITDQTMPRMTGMELVRKVRSRRPEMPVIICTGYSSVLSKTEAEELGVGEILMKPVERKKLARQIRKVLDLR
ncbi:MAG: PAS domain S-box protein [Desulfobulbaceae bacterium]|nr:PAS domain S-box protein [Desulfobulbaceae bacterium]